MNLKLRKFFHPEIIIVSFPIVIFLFIKFLTDYNGLYGQDSHEYFHYSKAITDFFKTGNSPGDYFWPVYYPVFGSVIGFITGNLFSLQLISVLSLSGSLYFLFKILEEIFNAENNFTIYLLITFLLSPFVLRNSLVVMADLLTVFFITASFYFLIDYLHKNQLKQIIFFFVFITFAFFTRYAAIVVLFLPLIIIVYQINKNNKLLHLFIPLLIVVILSIPHILLKATNPTGFLNHEWLNDWSTSNFFKSDFITQEGTQNYRFLNIIYSFSSLFFPTYLVFGLVLFVLSQRNLPNNKFWLISVGIVLFNAVFLAGIPFQNQRYLLLSYPFVVIAIFPGFQRLTNVFVKRKVLFYSILSVMLILQIFYCIYYFKPVFERNILEKEIAGFINNIPQKNIYAFDIDVSFKSYDVKKNVINMWKEKIPDFKPNSIVVFNENKFKTQWADKNPMLNWNNLKSNYRLNVLKDFGNGWKIFEIGGYLNQ